MVDKLEAVEMAAFGASDAACYLYPGEHQQAERAAFCEGAGHAVKVSGSHLNDVTPANGEQVERALAAAQVELSRQARDSDAMPYVGDGDDDEQVLDGIFDLRAIVNAILATPPTPTEDARERVKVLEEEEDGLAWLADHPRCSLEHFGPVYGDDDDQSEGWRVMRENGSINDREWDEIGRGDTPAEALTAARTALGNKETDRHE